MINTYKTSIYKTIAIFLLTLIPVIAFATQKEIEKIEKALTEKRYSRSLKLSEKFLKNESKNGLVLMYKSQSLFYLYIDPITNKKYKNGLKDAIKTADRALNLEEGAILQQKFKDYLEELGKENNKEGEEAFKIERYVKASQHFRLSLLFNPNDTFANFYLGSCYWHENQKDRSIEYLTKVVEDNFSAYAESVSQHTYQFKAFRYLAEYYMKAEKWEDAAKYLKMGLEMFPEDHILKGHRYGLYRVKVRSLPPSLDYLNEVRLALVDYPQDSFFLVKENSLYIFLFKQALKDTNTKQADSILGIFVLDKIEKSKRADKHFIIKNDIFVGDSPEKVFRKLLDYSVNKYHKDIFAWLSQKWVSEVLNKDYVSSSSYLDLAEKEFTSGNKNFATLMLWTEYRRASRKGDNDARIVEIASKWAYSDLPLLGLDYMHELLGFMRNGKFKTKVDGPYRHVKLTFIDSLAGNNFFFRAYPVFEQAVAEFPLDRKFLKEVKLRELANLDFKYNYFGSRISSWGQAPKAGEFPFYSDILPSNCEPGSLSDTLLERVAQRVNYFRRNSGVRKPIYFVRDLNIRCQHAALTFEANKTMTHNPADGIRCLTTLGEEGASKSLLVRENNPSLAITAMMGDKHVTQGNRRWLQFPITVNMGFGAGPTSQVLWVMDEGNKEDTSYFKQNFIAWPSDGFTPKMLCFSKWTFSIFDNLEGATVKVKNESGKEIPVKVEPLVFGYGMPTLVFEPEFELDKSNKDQKFEVTVKLKSGKTFTYSVTLFTPKVD